MFTGWHSVCGVRAGILQVASAIAAAKVVSGDWNLNPQSRMRVG